MARSIVCVARIDLCKSRANLAQNALVTNREHFIVLDGHMTDAVIEIVAGREHIVRHGKRRFGSKIGRGKLACGLAFPIFIHLMQGLFGFIGYVKRVCLARSYRIEFSL